MSNTSIAPTTDDFASLEPELAARRPEWADLTESDFSSLSREGNPFVSWVRALIQKDGVQVNLVRDDEIVDDVVIEGLPYLMPWIGGNPIDMIGIDKTELTPAYLEAVGTGLLIAAAKARMIEGLGIGKPPVFVRVSDSIDGELSWVRYEEYDHGPYRSYVVVYDEGQEDGVFGPTISIGDKTEDMTIGEAEHLFRVLARLIAVANMAPAPAPAKPEAA